ncbi:hypothetical protein PV08_09659 [Exophiala spinifera]|uniref:Lysine-specific metallo-endopeptidase domain-containing protein n=1 Tax=Exophiala spinifera TaxID=91928 RepID=A0A0D1ZHI4_9EURO|nr:uncharacterized protein PV08_09659 [Exophiala spinifera]KIW12382.1 hypothetical protein PV08_09659 [Exophiala spinifera]
MKLLPLLALLLPLRMALAQYPVFLIPEGTDNKVYEQLTHAFQDALKLARTAVALADPCDPAFRRYFQPQDFIFVHKVFRAVANIPLDLTIDSQNVEHVLNTGSLNPRYSQLSIAYGDNPKWSERTCEMQLPGDGIFGYLYFASPFGYMSLCRGTLFERFLTLEDTFNPPPWARANNDPNGQPLPGWGCDGFGDHDNSYMEVLGSWVLHELMHFQPLFYDIPNWKAIQHTGWIRDFPDGATPGMSGGPPNGYGPYYARLINALPPDPVMGLSQSVGNADNYAWYALSKYWSLTCGKPFGPSNTREDNVNFSKRKAPPQ